MRAGGVSVRQDEKRKVSKAAELQLYRNVGDEKVLVAASAILLLMVSYGGYKRFHILNIAPEPEAICFMAFLAALALIFGYVGIRELLYSKVPALTFLDDRFLYRGQSARRPAEILYSEVRGTGIREEQVKATLRRYVDVYRSSDRVLHIYTNDLSVSAEDIIDHLDRRWMAK